MGASYVRHVLLLSLLGFCFSLSHQQSDSCSTGVAASHLVPFNSTAFHCTAIWKQEDFILRYKNTGPSQWSFILSAPDKGSYVAVGFSGKGLMVGSSAVVGWSSGGKGTVKQYYLGGKSPDECTPDKGRLKLVKNKAVVVSQSGRLYLAFQLSTDYPQPHLIYAVGPDGDLPSANSLLAVHRSMASRAFNYTSGLASSAGGSGAAAFAPERKHGLLAMMGWGVLMPVGVLAARYFRRLDPYWFYSHMAIQVAGFAVGITAIVLGFRLNEDGLKNVDVHRALGIAILAMASLQFFGYTRIIWICICGDGAPRPAGQDVQGEAVLELVPPQHRPRGDPAGHRQHLPGAVHRAGGQLLHRLLWRLRRRVGDRRRRLRDQEVLPGRRLTEAQAAMHGELSVVLNDWP